MRVRFVAVVLCAISVGCTAPKQTRASGALVRTTAQSTVGVLLDEIPTGLRPRVARELVDRDERFWKDRAILQLRLTAYRLVFREAFYESGKKQLPLPPEGLWNIDLSSKAERRRVGGHDVVSVDYTFSSVLLTDTASPGVSEPRLEKVGGSWDEAFIFPIDPELILQRTGFACIDEEEFPFNSVDSEEVDSFYDQECDVEEGLSNEGQCHNTKEVDQSCADAVADHVGKVETAVRYERIGWDPKLADEFRYGKVTGDDPDLEIYEPDFATSRVTYRYIPASSCDVLEESVGRTGWRRLLQFATSDENVGNRALIIGSVDYANDGKPQELDKHRLFEFSPCHNHYHFKYYGDFRWQQGGDQFVNSKKGFCLQSTARTANREGSPLHNDFAGCGYQGMEAGWVDQYKIGLPGQWLDTTDLPVGKGTRSFTSNRLGLLCEGKFVDAKGKPLKPDEPPVWAATKLKAEDGKPVEAQRCRLDPSWDENNEHEVDEVIPQFGEGLITTPCTRGQLGPKRNCGFDKKPMIVNCLPGQRTTADFSIPKGAAPQVVRVTEYSHALKSAIPARYEDSYVPLKPGVRDQPYMLANEIVMDSNPTKAIFTCPTARSSDAREPGGTYSVYTGPVFPSDAHSAVSRI